MTPWVLLPIKSIDLGKSRIAACLAPEARRQLNIELLHRSLGLLQTWPGLSHTCVISPCPEVLALAREAGAMVIPQQGEGLNEAVRQALHTSVEDEPGLRALGGPGIHSVLDSGHGLDTGRQVLILSGDLPFASEADLRAMVSCPEEVVIATDRAEQGTNALCMSFKVASTFDFQYGLGSCGLHAQEARSRGLSVRVLYRNGLAFDIDTWRDCIDWQQAEMLSA